MATAIPSSNPLGSLAGATIPALPGSVARQPAKAAPSAPPPESPPTDVKLVEETRQQIRHLIQEIAQLAQSDMNAGDFYNAFLQRVVSALAATGGAVWHVDEDGKLELQYQINLPATGITSGSPAALRHAKLLKRVIADGKPELIAPQSGDGGNEGGNPTDSLLVLGILVIDQKVRGVVEIFQRPGAGPGTQRGYLRFLAQMCDLASDYLKNREIRLLGEEQSWSRQLDGFLRGVHRSLDRDTTAFTIANDGRKLIDCDRVSVGLLRGGSCELIAVSGLASVDTRATTVARLQELCAVAAAAEEALWYSGETGDMAPQVESALEAYVDASHSHTIAILPLRAAVPESGDSAARPKLGAIVGVLVAEQIQAGQVSEQFRRRVLSVVDASGPAWANSLEHSQLFLLPVLKLFGVLFSLFDSERLPRTVSVVGLIAAIVLALFVTPWHFEVQANGALHPEIERDIFAGIDGEVTDILVDHLSDVQAGAELLRMRNNDLAVGMQTLIGQRATIAEQILALQRRIIEGRRSDPEEQNRLTGELAQLKKTDESLRQQIDLHKQKEEQLVVRSPIRGQIITWQIRELLMQRPVVRGQVLMTVVDPTGKWDLHIDMPESKLGYVAQAAKQSQTPLLVTFVLATHPGQEFQARVTEVHALADAGNGSSTVRIRAAIDAEKLPELRPGAQVVARVSCGTRPLGFVLFHDVITFVQTQYLSWF